MTAVGRSIPKLENREKVLGRAEYIDDLYRPGMLHAAILGSPHAHAKILSYDVSEALAAQGVVAVHCLGGLRSTGTLIGLYLMKHHRFTFCIVARTRECVANLVVFACDCSGAINVRK